MLLADTPWSHVFLGEAHELGEGAGQDRTRAIEHYRAAASQPRDQEARRRAEEALVRLQPARQSAR